MSTTNSKMNAILNGDVMEYKVVTTQNLDFSAAEVALVDKFVWDSDYMPKTEARLIYVENKGFALRMECEEKDPKATYYNFYDPVYKDSCLEMFLTLDGVRYMNIEMNANGASLMAIGAGRKERTHIDKIMTPPAVKAGNTENGWFAEVYLTIDEVKILYPTFKFEKGARFRGNFYKCGDETQIPHHGMWSPVGTEKPDFHRPEYFGDFVIV